MDTSCPVRFPLARRNAMARRSPDPGRRREIEDEDMDFTMETLAEDWKANG